jgi:hypothetical protein
MKKGKLILLMAACCFGLNYSFAQCPGGEAEVTLSVSTDDYGYEGYWEIVPTGNNCGTGTVASGGNTAVGCSGGGLQNQTPGGYGNNVTETEGPWCLPIGACYDLIFVDDWGDGGFNFDVIVNGYVIESFEGLGTGGTYSFCVNEPEPYDVGVFSSNVTVYANVGSFDLNASIFNYGTTTINTYDLNYTVNGGPVQTHNVTGSALANNQSENQQHSIPVSVPANGFYTVNIWADNLNGGNSDTYNLNDTLTEYFEAGPGTPNIIDGYVNATGIAVEQIAGSAQQVNSPTDLDFHPVLTNKELWVINKGTENSGGSTVTIYDAGEVSQTSLWKQDGNAWHFMSLPTGLAFSSNGNWANSPGVYDANHNGGAAFTGPSLWSSNMAIYAEPSGGNGSHLDMLHLSPESQGVAAEIENVFWIFDGYNGDLVRYDFVEDHGPGNSYHGDAIVRRYSDDALAKDPADEVVSHIILDENRQWLYVVDHGNQRVIRIDITTGSNQGGAPNYPMNEPVAEYTEYTGYTQETAVTGLSKPAGIDVIGDRMIVSEYQSGEIIIYDISAMPAVELDRITTGYTSVQGVKIGPDGKIWFVDQNSNGVYRINADNLGLIDVALEFNIYPNPSTGVFNVVMNSATDGSVEVRDLNGKLISSQAFNGQATTIELDVQSGMYFVQVVQGDVKSEIQRVIIE